MWGDARGVAVLGDWAYVANGYAGLRVIDVSNPANPQIIGSVYTSGHAWDAAVIGDRAYVTVGGNGLVILPLSVEATAVAVNPIVAQNSTCPRPSFPRRRESRQFSEDWMPACAGIQESTRGRNKKTKTVAL